jgi:TonB family protein
MNGSVAGPLAGIKRFAMVLGAVGLFFSASDIVGQSNGGPSSAATPSQAASTASPGTQGVEILSDTQGVDFSPYIRGMMRTIMKTWIPLIPEEGRPPYNAQGETTIRFTINPDGKIGTMHLDASDQQVKFDRAAWGAITGVGQFPPLPAKFTGPNLELRIHFKVNKPRQ